MKSILMDQQGQFVIYILNRHHLIYRIKEEQNILFQTYRVFSQLLKLCLEDQKIEEQKEKVLDPKGLRNCLTFVKNDVNLEL